MMPNKPSALQGLFQRIGGKAGPAIRLLLESPRQFVRELGSRLITFEFWNVYILKEEAASITTSFPGMVVKKFEKDDYLAFSKDPTRIGEQVRLFYMKRGIDNCYGFFLNGELVFSVWIYSKDDYAKEPFQTLKLRENEVELKHGLTKEAWRGRGLLSYCEFYAAKHLLPKHVNRIYGTIDPHNIASIRGSKKTGFVPCGYVWRFYFNFLPFGRKWAVRKIRMHQAE